MPFGPKIPCYNSQIQVIGDISGCMVEDGVSICSSFASMTGLSQCGVINNQRKQRMLHWLSIFSEGLSDD